MAERGRPIALDREMPGPGEGVADHDGRRQQPPARRRRRRQQQDRGGRAADMVQRARAGAVMGAQIVQPKSA